MQVVPTNVRTILVLLLLAFPATASAASVEMLRSTQAQFSAPSLAGDSVVATIFRGNEVVDVVSGTAGAPARRLLRLTVANGNLLSAASGNRVLAQTGSESGTSDLYGGPLAGPLTKLATCPQTISNAFAPAPALDGDLTATAATDCVRNRLRMQLGGTTRIVDASGYVHAIAAAGRYVAWIDSDLSSGAYHLTVYDVQAGQTAYTLQIKPTDWLDVQADGTAALTQFDDTLDRRPCNTFQEHPTYFTVAEPAAHTLPQVTCFRNVKIAGGRIAFVEHLADGGDRLELVNLAGTQVQSVARVDAQPTAPADFDYDGTHVAWTQTRCRDFVVLRRDASDTSPESPAVSCPVRVGRPILRRDGTLHLAVSCPNGCRSTPGNDLSGIQIVSPHWLHVWDKTRSGSTRYSPFVPFSLQAGKRTVVRLPLTSHQRALLRRKHSASVRLKVLLQNVYLPRVARTAHA
jgi:hypothetical protein